MLSDNLFVIQVEMDLYSMLKKVMYYVIITCHLSVVAHHFPPG